MKSQKKWKVILILCWALLFLMGCGTSVENDHDIYIEVDTSKQVTSDSYDIPFPRLGMWWLDPYEESAEAIAKYDLLLLEMDDPELWPLLEDIRSINEDIILLRPLSPSEQIVYFDYNEDWPNPIIKDLPTDFFLMHTGTTISESITRDDTWLVVEDLYSLDGDALFYIGDDVAIGTNESARILDINEKTKSLELDRGYGRSALDHEAGTKIQAHVRFWPGTWVMNVTSACPELMIEGVDEPVDYITYFYLACQNKVEGLDQALDNDYLYIDQEHVNYDGFIIDRFEDSQEWLSWMEDYRPIDPYQKNEIIAKSEFDELVIKTVDQYTNLLRQAYDDPIIIRNNPTTVRHDAHNGQVYESFGWSDVSSDFWQNLYGGDATIITEYEEDRITYLGWFELKDNPLVLMEVYDDESVPDSKSQGEYDNPYEQKNYKPNEKRFRLSFTSALLGDGFYSYEINTNGHGSLGLLWFDAYDLGRDEQGYLGYPLGPYEKVEDHIYMRSFEHGVVLVNASEEAITPHFNIDLIAVKGFDGERIDALDGCIYLYD